MNDDKFTFNHSKSTIFGLMLCSVVLFVFSYLNCGHNSYFLSSAFFLPVLAC